MKKSFFKKLSFVLALAMIVSTIAPAASAFAAATPKISTTATQYLLLGQSNEYDFNVANKVAGATYKWTSNNTKVATVSTKGVAVAKAVGTATIKLTATVKGKKYASSAKVVVKDNFKTLKIAGAPADGKLAVNAENTFSTTGTTYGGASSSKTAVIGWVVTDADGKATTGATITDAGVFKATVAGTYKVVATAYQSSAKKTAGVSTATDSTTVTVANVATVKQADVTSFKLTFASPVDALTTADVAVSYVAGSTDIAAVVKEVKLSTDKLSATVTLYGEFIGGSTYNVAVKGFDKLSFVAAATGVTDVATMTITPATAAINTATKVVVKLFNKDGVDITNSTLLGKVSIANSSDKTWLDGNSAITTSATPYKINIYNLGDTATLTATLHSYSYDTATGLEKDTKTATATITGVAAVTYTTSGIAAWTLTAPIDGVTSNLNDPKHTLAANDGSKLLSIKTTLNDSDSTAVYSATVSSVASNPHGQFKFESSDSSVLVVNTLPGGNGATLSPVKAGSATVVVSYTADSTATNVVWTYVGAVPITVGADRAATALNLSTYAFNLSTNYTNSKTVDVTVLDQYGDKMNITSGTVAADLNSTNLPSLSPSVAYPETQKATVTFNGAGQTAGQYSYKVTVGKLSKYITITIATPSNLTSGATGNYVRLDLSGNSFDQKLSSTTHAVSATIGLLEYAPNGVAVGTLSATGAGYTVKVYDADGNLFPIDGLKLIDNTATQTLKVISGAATSGGTYIALKTGTWKVTLTKNSNNTVVDSVSFDIKDTTTLPAVKINTTHPTATTLATAINEAITASLSTGDLNSTSNATLYTRSGDVVGSGTSVYVKNVRYYDTTLQYEYVIAVNTTLYAPSGSTY